MNTQKIPFLWQYKPQLQLHVIQWLFIVVAGLFAIYAVDSHAQASTNTIVVRMSGVAGSESVSLQVGGTTVNTWTPTSSMASYTATTGSSGEIRVAFTNDADGRDVQVDYLTVNGETRQAEDQSTNTASYNNGCGLGSHSEWMYCSGYISFGNVGAPAASSSSSIASSACAVSNGQQCNWYGTNYPLCVTTQNGWGWEDQQSCISASTCSGQPSPFGIVGGNGNSACPGSSSSSSAVSSTGSNSSSSSSSSSTGSPSDPLEPSGEENSGADCFMPSLPAYSNLSNNAAL